MTDYGIAASPTGQGNLQIEILGFMDVAAYVTWSTVLAGEQTQQLHGVQGDPDTFFGGTCVVNIDREKLPHRSLATIQAIQETKDSWQVSRLARRQ